MSVPRIQHDVGGTSCASGHRLLAFHSLGPVCRSCSAGGGVRRGAPSGLGRCTSCGGYESTESACW
jgi:hypothetical protein